ncbi:MAG: glutamate--tRNA ligase [Candidatus Izemoplasmatales bacterium]
MNKKIELANLIFPEVTLTLEDLERMYPKRNLPEGAFVTRFAPSPTGFLHMGSLFASMISWRLAKQSGGVFYVRIEDTDQKREIEGSRDQVLSELSVFGVNPDESVIHGGAYGPYVQSERKWIYDIVLKHMISTGLAYPCFCSHEELDDIRKKQEELKVNPGYYGEYAVCRFLTDEEMIKKIQNNESYVIRFKSPGKEDTRVAFDDAIRGHIEFPENTQDIIIMKGDLLPTYHFAHLVDDHFMRTTHISRGEEWMSSVPIHLQLFDAIGWEKPIYAHLPVINKLDEGKRRKLSKRKDPEASVKYFLTTGYPINGFLEYLMTIANTNFEEWRIQNPVADIFDFHLAFDKMSLDGALFDMEKLKSISKEVLGNMDAATISKKATSWAEVYDVPFFQMIESNKTMFEQILAIERGGEKPRKDYSAYSEIFPIINFMYDDYYNEFLKQPLEFNERFTKEQIKDVLNAFLSNPGLDLSEEDWFNNLKETAEKLNYAPRPKDYKKNPELYTGHIGDFAEIIRIAVSTRKSTPNFYHILSILGEEKVIQRIQKVLSLL